MRLFDHLGSLDGSAESRHGAGSERDSTPSDLVAASNGGEGLGDIEMDLEANHASAPEGPNVRPLPFDLRRSPFRGPEL